MRKLGVFLIALGLGLTAAIAQDDSVGTTIGNDRFMGGTVVTHSTPGTDDLFMAGETLRLAAEITGTAHMAGRSITIAAPVGGDAYVAGMELTVASPVAGDVTIAGYTLDISGAVGGDVRAAGSNVALRAPVEGYASLTGEVVRLDAPVAGDVVLTARTVEFGDGAKIGGKLTLFEEKTGQTTVPDRVIDPARINRVEIEMTDGEFDWAPKVFDWRNAVSSFIKGVIAVTLIAAGIAAVAPERMATLRRGILHAPFRSLWIGFLTESVAIGAVVVLALTIIGLAIAPFVLVLAIAGAFLGYVVAAYALGVGCLLAIGRAEPASLGERALAAAVGAILAALIALVPWVGWLFVLAAVLAGLGALATMIFRPAFFADTPSGSA